MHVGGKYRLQLPGGLLMNGRLERQAVLHPLTGILEQRLGELLDSAKNTPGTVTEVLDMALASVGGQPMQPGGSCQLCVADRQFLMVRLALLTEGDQVWLRPLCEQCGTPFDVGYHRSAIPLKPAGPGYPYAQVKIEGRDIKVRVPVGADQEAIASHDEEGAIRELVWRCIISIDGIAPAEDFVDYLTPEVVQVIEEALDEAAPQMGARIATACPACGADQVVELNPSEDKTARIWDVATGKEIHVLKGHKAGLAGAVISPDGKWIVTASKDKTLRIWPGNSLEVLRLINEVGIRGKVRELTEVEKKEYNL
jgi:hypothetical protein